jgi:NAD/ferredoxin-dependent reductase-like protein
MLGLPAPASSPASFWSDQYGLRIQYLGYAPLGDRVEIDERPGAQRLRRRLAPRRPTGGRAP